MNATLYQIFLIVLGSNALFGFIQFLISRHDSKKVSPERLMLRALGSDRLGVLLRDWLHSDDRYAADWEVIENLYKGYKELGGNGEITKLYEEAKELKTTE